MCATSPVLVFAGEVETTTRATSARRSLSRLSASLGTVRAVAVDARGVDETRRTTFGLEAGPLLFGPVDLTGLHRLSRSPLGFEPRSSVYAEATGLGLDTTMEPTSRVGGGLELLRGAVGLTVFEDPEARTGALALRLGATPGRDSLNGWPRGGRRASSRLGIDTLVAASDAGERPAGPSWYPDEPGFAGGPLVHGAIRATLGPDTAPASGGPGGGGLRVTHLGLTMLGSSGRFARSAGAALFRAGVAGPLGPSVSAGAAAAVGVEQPWYRDRTGKRPTEWMSARLSLFVDGEVVRLGMKGRSVLEDRPLEVGAESPRELVVAPEVEVGGRSGAYGTAAAAREWLWDSDGERRRDGEVEVGIGYRQALLRTGVEIQRQWEGAEYEDAVRGEVALGGAEAPAGLRFEHWIRVRWPDGVAGGGAGGSLAGGGSGGGVGGRRAAPPGVEGAAGLSARPGPVTISLHVQTERSIELSGTGRRALEAAPFDYLSVRLELRLRIAVADLDAQHESGYLEVYGKPDNVDDGGHEGAGHDGGIESEAMDEERRDDTDD